MEMPSLLKSLIENKTGKLLAQDIAKQNRVGTDPQGSKADVTHCPMNRKLMV